MPKNLSLSSYQSSGESVSLKKIDGQKFSIVKVENSDYDDNGEQIKGVRITTKEKFDIDGEKKNQFHTTRIAIVNKLQNEKLRADLENDGILNPVVCKMVPAAKGGKDYWDLVEA